MMTNNGSKRAHLARSKKTKKMQKIRNFQKGPQTRFHGIGQLQGLLRGVSSEFHPQNALVNSLNDLESLVNRGKGDKIVKSPCKQGVIGAKMPL